MWGVCAARAMRLLGATGVVISLLGGALAAAVDVRLFKSVEEQLTALMWVCLVVGAVVVVGVLVVAVVQVTESGRSPAAGIRDRSLIVEAARAMEGGELEQAIAALDGTERRLLIEGRIDEAREVSADKMICVSVRDNRRRLGNRPARG